MILSNRERQQRHRARQQSRTTLFLHLLERWVTVREDLLRELEMLESGAIRTRTNNVDTTAQSIARVRAHIAQYSELVERMSEDGLPIAFWRIEPSQAHPSMFTAVQVPHIGEVAAHFNSLADAEAWLEAKGLRPSNLDPDVWIEP